MGCTQQRRFDEIRFVREGRILGNGGTGGRGERQLPQLALPEVTKPARSGGEVADKIRESKKKGRGSALFLVKILEKKKNQIIMNYYVMNVSNESVMPT